MSLTGSLSWAGGQVVQLKTDLSAPAEHDSARQEREKPSADKNITDKTSSLVQNSDLIPGSICSGNL